MLRHSFEQHSYGNCKTEVPVHATGAYRGIRVITPPILNLGVRVKVDERESSRLVAFQRNVQEECLGELK